MLTIWFGLARAVARAGSCGRSIWLTGIATAPTSRFELLPIIVMTLPEAAVVWEFALTLAESPTFTAGKSSWRPASGHLSRKRPTTSGGREFTTMKRSYLKRKTPLRASQTGLRRTPLAKCSPKHSRALRTYSKLRKEYLADNPMCEVGLKTGWGCGICFTAEGDCRMQTQPSEEIHHTRGRGRNLNNVSTFLAVCKNCHRRLHHQPQWARLYGWLAPVGKSASAI